MRWKRWQSRRGEGSRGRRARWKYDGLIKILKVVDRETPGPVDGRSFALISQPYVQLLIAFS